MCPLPERHPITKVPEKDCPFVSRGGIKLQHALNELHVDVQGKVAADLGSNVGGFVDCLLAHGALKVYSVDTSYGTLAWKLRQDPRVVVLERTNALHMELPERVDLVTIDVGWTRQHWILPKALTLIKPNGQVLSLLKPQYEANPDERHKGVVKPQCYEAILERVRVDLHRLGIPIHQIIPSAIPGSGGNREYFMLIEQVLCQQGS